MTAPGCAPYYHTAARALMLQGDADGLPDLTTGLRSLETVGLESLEKRSGTPEVHEAEGFELKGLAYPGREADYDCKSQVPRGEHNGRQVYCVHKNKNFRGFGSYGDILVRDRKMYVAPTPFALTEGTAHHRTLIAQKTTKLMMT